jgi:hypothetical protein
VAADIRRVNPQRIYISLVNELQGGNKMSIADMLAYIYTHLPSADEFTIEQIFDFLQEVEY